MLPQMVMSAFPLPKLERFPCTFSTNIDDQVFMITLSYNDYGHFFTFSIAKDDGEEIVCGKLVYGMDFFQPFRHVPELRGFRMTPFDMALRHSEITPTNFGQEVQLYFAKSKEK